MESHWRHWNLIKMKKKEHSPAFNSSFVSPSILYTLSAHSWWMRSVLFRIWKQQSIVVVENPPSNSYRTPAIQLKCQLRWHFIRQKLYHSCAHVTNIFKGHLRTASTAIFFSLLHLRIHSSVLVCPVHISQFSVSVFYIAWVQLTSRNYPLSIVSFISCLR